MGTVQNFLIMGIDRGVWELYASWFTLRGMAPPVYTNDGVFVATHDRTVLLAGVSIYPTDGPYAVVEFAATNPDPSISARTKYEAMIVGARALTQYGAMRKKWMLCFPNSKGLELVLKKAGFVYSDAKVMKCQPLGEL